MHSYIVRAYVNLLEPMYLLHKQHPVTVIPNIDGTTTQLSEKLAVIYA